jgi:hypothetical protein
MQHQVTLCACLKAIDTGMSSNSSEDYDQHMIIISFVSPSAAPRSLVSGPDSRRCLVFPVLCGQGPRPEEGGGQEERAGGL